MVIDTSAIVAILFGEPDQHRFGEAIEAAPVRLLSAVTRVEASCVVEGRKQDAGAAVLDRFLALIDAQVVAATAQHADLAVTSATASPTPSPRRPICRCCSTATTSSTPISVPHCPWRPRRAAAETDCPAVNPINTPLKTGDMAWTTDS